MPAITVEQVRNLWADSNPAAIIDRGDDQPPVTRDDLADLAGQIDTDDAGTPLPDQWQVLVDQLNSDEDQPAWFKGEEYLEAIDAARARRDRTRTELDDDEAELADAIRAAVASRTAAITEIAATARLSRERIYQIRDQRR
jgi:hypothetical protein